MEFPSPPPKDEIPPSPRANFQTRDNIYLAALIEWAVSLLFPSCFAVSEAIEAATFIRYCLAERAAVDVFPLAPIIVPES